MQYTVRNIPKRIDDVLRKKAKAEGRSLNDVVLDALSRGAGLGTEKVKYRDLSWMAGTWVEDPAFDESMDEHEIIWPERWPGLNVPPVEVQRTELAGRRKARQAARAKRDRKRVS